MKRAMGSRTELGASAAAASAMLLLLLPRAEPLGGLWASPTLQVWVITPAAVVCLAGSLVVVVLGWRRHLAEIAVLGTGLVVLSAASVLHGLALAAGPDTPVAWFTMAIALPAGLAAASPLWALPASARRWVGTRWRDWVAAWLATAAVVSGLLVAGMDGWVPQPGPNLRWALLVVSLVGAGRLAARQVRLYRIGGRAAPLVTAVAVVHLGAVSALAAIASTASVAWWAGHGVNGASVLAVVVAAALLARRNHSLEKTLAPVVNDDPLAALELGLTPEVHAFIAALDEKDRSTRDHVVRVGELAMRVGERAGLSARELRTLGLGALLHDIGKLVIPSQILQKPGALTDEEFERIKSHPARGAALLQHSPVLNDVAPLVRGHHERYDGTGYPDRLARDAIPLLVAIISVCDAWDAMTNDRHYQAARSHEQARDILLGGAGSQWHPRAVELLLEQIRAQAPTGAFHAVGSRTCPIDLPPGVCDDPVPAEIVPGTQHRVGVQP